MSERCQLGLSPETLSAWRAQALPASKQAEITTHVANCSPCQTTVTGFERVAQLLRTPPAMPTQAAVWRGVQASITIQRGNMTNSRKTLTLTGLGAAASIITILAVVFVLLNNHAGQTHPISVVGSPSPTATAMPSPTPTIETLKTPLPKQGWITVPALSFAKNMTFSVSDPLTGYACGNVGVSASNSAKLQLSITHDGGRTWQVPIATVIQGASCSIYTNPTNAEDIVVLGGSCWSACSSSNIYPYRSHDGGQTWTKLQLPADEPNDNVRQPTWIGNSVYFIVQIATNIANSPRPPHSILVNRSGSTLEIIDDSQLFTGENSTDAVQHIWSYNGSLFVGLGICFVCFSIFAKTSVITLPTM